MKKLLKTSALLLLLAAPAFCWETIGDGIEYQSWTIDGPNNVFATRMDRNNPNASIAMTQAKDAYKGNQTVRSQMSDNDGRIFYDGTEWGKRYKPIAGVNGDFYLSGGKSRGIRINDGHLTVSMGHDDTIWGGFYWTAARQALQSASYIKNTTIFLKYTDNSVVDVTDVNASAADNGYTMYNAKYGLRSPSDSDATDMLVYLGKPNIIGAVMGKVKSITTGGNTVIPFDCCVITAKGTAATELRSKAKVGDVVTITSSAYSCTSDHTTRVNLPVNTLAAISGLETVLENGVVMPYDNFPALHERHPRTAVGYNDRYIFFMVCDGRRSGVSIGMTGREMGNFLKDVLGATNGICLDGGGSSTMVTNGTVRNRPSDNSERAVANALIMYNIQPKDQATNLSPCQRVTTNASSLSVRRGPGTHNPAIDTVSSGTAGYVTNHGMGGIKNGSNYWWEVKFDSGLIGWVAGNYLTAGAKDTTPPSVPTGLKQKAVTGTTITLGWNASSDNSGYMGHYNIYRDNVLVASTEETEYTDKNLAQDTSYSYRISAVDYAGNESAKGTAVTMATHFDETPPSVPENLRLETATGTSLSFTWDASTDDTAVTGYKVYRGTKLLATVNASSRNYTDTGLSPTVTYSYYVSAFDAQNNTSAKSQPLKLRCYKTDFSEGFPNTDKWTVDRATLSTAKNHGTIEGDNSLYVSADETPYMNALLGLGYRTGRFGVWFYDAGNAGTQIGLYLKGVSETGEELISLGVAVRTETLNYCGVISPAGGETEYVTLKSRSSGWHHLEIEILPGGRLVFFIDNVKRAERTSEAVALCAFKQLFIGDNTAVSGGNLYIDDITFDERTPDAPTTINVASATPDSITWSFTHAGDNAVKYMVYDGSTLMAESGMWLTKAVTETGLTPNTRYTRKITAALGNMTSSVSYSGGGCTAAVAPCDDTISYTAPGNVSDPNVTLTSLIPYGAGTVSYYRVCVDTLPMHEFDDTETRWDSASYTYQLPLSVMPYYIHVRAYNMDNLGGEVMNIGPYRYGVPPVSVVEAKNMADGSQVMIEDCTVTAVFADCAYIEKNGFGIKVTPAGVLRVGDVTSIAGTLGTVDGERVIVTE